MVGKYKKTCDYVILFWKWKRLMQNIVPHRNFNAHPAEKGAECYGCPRSGKITFNDLDHQLLNTWRLET